MKKILSLALGLSFVFGTLAIAQDTSNQGSTDSSKSTTKKHNKKSKKSKSTTPSDTSSAPKQ